VSYALLQRLDSIERLPLLRQAPVVEQFISMQLKPLKHKSLRPGRESSGHYLAGLDIDPDFQIAG